MASQERVGEVADRQGAPAPHSSCSRSNATHIQGNRVYCHLANYWYWMLLAACTIEGLFTQKHPRTPQKKPEKSEKKTKNSKDFLEDLKSVHLV